jgi:uncharacterized protein YkwD
LWTHLSDTYGKLRRFLLRHPPLFAFIASVSLFFTAGPALGRGASSTDASVVRAINAARTTRGLRPVSVDARLARAAHSHSSDMLRRQYFDHGPFASRMRAFGARGPRFGEAISWTSGMGAPSIVADWISSPPHRAILLRPGFTRVGVGSTYGRMEGNDALLVTADFAGA